jgi:predicted dehydrogenase
MTETAGIAASSERSGKAEGGSALSEAFPRTTGPRLGVIGSGGFLRKRVPYLLAGGGVVIAAVTEPNLEMREMLVKALPEGSDLPKFFDDHTAMLSEGGVEAVVVASPHGHHFRHVTDVLEAGRPALVYKPMVISGEQAEALSDTVAKTGMFVSIAIEGIYTAEFRHIRELRERGELGTVQLVTGLMAQEWLPMVDGTWRTDPALGGGGNLIDSGYHLLAAMLHLTGQVPDEVFAYVDRKGREIDVFVSATLRFPGGALGSVVVSADAKGMEEGIYLEGSERCLVTGVYGRRLAFVTGTMQQETLELPAAESAEENFVRSVRGEAKTLTPVELGLGVARVIEAILSSADQGRPVPVNA